MEIQKTIGDGACLYRAISECITGTVNDYKKIKEDVIHQIRDNK
jgi:hypothetical protein